ncbi:MAG: BON domain-containing protein [Aquisalinus sp.]|nr:BON domain-containing protein [Aquisalinus sp.]
MRLSLFKGLLVAAAASVMITGCATNRTFGGGVDDVTADINLRARLFDDGLYDYSDVDLTVYEGRVLLTGTMRTREGKKHLEQLAARSANVEEVMNEIIIGQKTPFNQGTSDALIDEKLGFALLADNGVYRANYQIAVSGGIVYLLGVAQGPAELTRVTDHARNIRGVNKVVSHVLYVGDPRRQTRAASR